MHFPRTLVALLPLVLLSGCAAAPESEDAEGLGSAVQGAEPAAPLEVDSDWPKDAKDLSWLLDASAATAYLFPGRDIMADSFRPGGYAAFSKDEPADLEPGKAASFKLPTRSAFDHDSLGISGVMITSKPVKFTFCALDDNKRGFCKESIEGDGQGTAVSFDFAPSDAVVYAVIIRGTVVGNTIEPYADDEKDSDDWSVKAMWRVGQRPAKFPEVPWTKIGW